MLMRVILPRHPTRRQLATYRAFLCDYVLGLPLEEWEFRMGRPLTWNDIRKELDHAR